MMKPVYCDKCEVWQSRHCTLCHGTGIIGHEYIDEKASMRRVFVLHAYALAVIFIVLSIIIGVGCLGAEPEAYHLTYTRNGDIHGHGSCFAISKTTVLTARHNCYHDKKPLDCYMIVAGIKYPLTLVKEDIDLDLALCSVAGTLLTPNTIADVAPDLPIILTGFPRGELKTCKGELIRHYYEGTARSLLRVVFDHGCSGGCVSQGSQIVGIAVAGVLKGDDLDKGKALFLPYQVIKYFLAAPVK